jgi:hypothetical protein
MWKCGGGVRPANVARVLRINALDAVLAGLMARAGEVRATCQLSGKQGSRQSRMCGPCTAEPSPNAHSRLQVPETGEATMMEASTVEERGRQVCSSDKGRRR